MLLFQIIWFGASRHSAAAGVRPRELIAATAQRRARDEPFASGTIHIIYGPYVSGPRNEGHRVR